MICTPTNRLLGVLYLIVAICYLPSIAHADVQDRRANEFTLMELKQVAEQIVDKAKGEALPESRLFIDADAFAAWWEEMGWEEEDLPEVDFESSFLCIQTRDAADPNRVRWSARHNEDGEAELMGISTLIGFEPSEKIKMAFLSVEREEATSLVRWERVKDEDGKWKRVKKSYPLIKPEPDPEQA